MYGLGVEGGSERFSNMGHCSGPSRTASNTGERWIESPFGTAGGMIRAQGQEELDRANSVEVSICGEQCPSYSKSQLLAIYDTMLWNAKGSLPAPDDVELPQLLQKKHHRDGLMDVRCEDWLCYDSENRVVKGPLSRAELGSLWEMGSLLDDVAVLPLSWLQTTSMPLKQMLQIWRESEKLDLRMESGDADLVWVGSQELGSEGGRASRGSGGIEGASSSNSHRLGEKDVHVGQWFYKDRQGHAQGPYPTSQLIDWWNQGFFDQHLKIKPEAWEGEFFVPMTKLLVCLHAGDEEWMYKDEHSVLQGPFATEQIVSWWEDGYLPFDLPMHAPSWERKEEFLPLIHLMVKWREISDDWIYKDSMGMVQGPFPKTSIVEMWRNRQLPSNLFVKPVSWVRSDFVPLEQMLEAF